MKKNWTNRKLQKDDFSIENQLILLLSRGEELGVQPHEIQDLISSNSVDWSVLQNTAIDSYLAPLIYSNEKKMGLDILPPSVREACKLFKLEVASINTLLYYDYQKFQKACNAQGIFCTPIKGIFLAEKVYEDTALRQLSDIDLVVFKKDQNAIFQLLDDLEWKVKMSFYKSKFHEHFNKKHTPFMAINKRSAIDFHYELFDKNELGVSMPITTLVNRLRSDELIGLPISTLDLNDQLIYLWLHLKKHLNFAEVKIISFVDIALFIEKYKKELNFKLISKRSQEFNSLSDVKTVLTIVNQIWLKPNHGIFNTEDFEEVDPFLNKVVHYRMGDYTFSWRDRVYLNIQQRFKVPSQPWKKIPMLWYDLFPTRNYLEKAYGKTGYWNNWLVRNTAWIKKLTGKS